MKSIQQSFLEKETKTGWVLILTLLTFSLLVLLGQSMKFVSPLWIVIKIGFDIWQEHISRMLDKLVFWAIVGGLYASIMTFVNSTLNDIKKVLSATAISFILGFCTTFLFVFLLGLLIYLPLGIISLIFSTEIYFTSLGFAFLCATYIIFFWMVVDVPPILIDIIKEAPIYFKLLAFLLSILLVTQIIGTILSIFQILIVNSVWQVHLPAFIIAIAGAFLVATIMTLFYLHKDPYSKKILAFAIIFFLSIITGNISDRLFHWGEYPSAVVAATISPLAYSWLINRMRRNPLYSISLLVGLVAGLGAGTLFARYIGLRIIGQGWFGIFCGSALAIGFGVAFGMLFAQWISPLLFKLFRIKPEISLVVSFGFVIGTVIATVIFGFMTR